MNPLDVAWASDTLMIGVVGWDEAQALLLRHRYTGSITVHYGEGRPKRIDLPQPSRRILLDKSPPLQAG